MEKIEKRQAAGDTIRSRDTQQLRIDRWSTFWRHGLHASSRTSLVAINRVELRPTATTYFHPMQIPFIYLDSKFREIYRGFFDPATSFVSIPFVFPSTSSHSVQFESKYIYIYTVNNNGHSSCRRPPFFSVFAALSIRLMIASAASTRHSRLDSTRLMLYQPNHAREGEPVSTRNDEWALIISREGNSFNRTTSPEKLPIRKATVCCSPILFIFTTSSTDQILRKIFQIIFFYLLK